MLCFIICISLGLCTVKQIINLMPAVIYWISLATFASKCLREHNLVRRQHGAKPLKWDANLARDALAWATKLNNYLVRTGLPPKIHGKDATKKGQGENVQMMPWTPTCKEIVEEWLALSCTSSIFFTFLLGVGHQSRFTHGYRTVFWNPISQTPPPSPYVPI